MACSDDDPSPRSLDPYTDRVPQAGRHLEAGILQYYSSNSGRERLEDPESIGSRVLTPDASPAQGVRAIVYDLGLWIGTTINGEARASATAFYSGDFGPEPRPGSDPVLVYLLKPNDPTEISDYQRWPTMLGAPATPEGHPRVIGMQTTWTMYNDLDASRHDAFHSSPLGAVVRETAWMQAALPSVLFLRYQVKNSSEAAWQGTTLGFWTDADLSIIGDLVGTDVARDMVYTYNDPNQPSNHPNASRPALGACFLKTPQDLGLTAAAKQWKNANEPNTAIEALRILNGVDIDGTAFIDSTTGEPTRFWASGDPVTHAGFIENVSMDRRMIGSTGPVDVPAGGSIELIVAVVYATGTDPLVSIGNLRLLADQVAHSSELWDIE